MDQTDTQQAFEKAMRSLSMRAHSESEIVEKLTRARFDERTIAEVMAKLYEYRLLDDEAFAAQWAEARTRRGMGPWRIGQELRQKGIDREIIDAVLAELDEDDAMEKAVELAEKHLRRGDSNARRRAYDALVRRGYGYDTARQALEHAIALIEEEDVEDEE